MDHVHLNDDLAPDHPPIAPAPLPARPRAAPVAETERIDALDVLRGFAVLGILLLNIQSFSMIGAAYINPTAYGDLEGVNGLVWFWTHLLGDQKFMSIFSMLFGAGIALMTERAETRTGRSAAVHYRRMAWLGLLGLLHAHLLWYGDILFIYAAWGMIVYLLRRAPAPALLLIGALVIAVGGLIVFGMGMLAQLAPAEARAGMSQGWAPEPQIVVEELEAFRGNWLDQAPHRSMAALMFETFMLVTGMGWKAGGLMLIGMGLYRTGVLTAERSAVFYRLLFLVGVGIGLPIVWFGVDQQRAHEWSMIHGMFSGMLYNYGASVAVALGYIGLVMAICVSLPRATLTRPVAAVGRMALTNYLMQTVICTSIFYGHGLGLFGALERIEQLGVVVAIWIVQLAWSPLWLKSFRYGPAEWAWRRLTYWRPQSLRRSR